MESDPARAIAAAVVFSGGLIAAAVGFGLGTDPGEFVGVVGAVVCVFGARLFYVSYFSSSSGASD